FARPKRNCNVCWARVFASRTTRAREELLSSTAISPTSTEYWSCYNGTKRTILDTNQKSKKWEGNVVNTLPVWVGHSCPTLLGLVLQPPRVKPHGKKPKSKASDKSVRPTRAPDPHGSLA